MMNNDFEEAFADFLERREYDEAEAALFGMVRTAFLAGWKSAGGEPPVPQRIFQLIHCGASAPETSDAQPAPDAAGGAP